MKKLVNVNYVEKFCEVEAGTFEESVKLILKIWPNYLLKNGARILFFNRS